MAAGDAAPGIARLALILDRYGPRRVLAAQLAITAETSPSSLPDLFR